MSLRGRIMSLIGFFLALLLGIGTWGVWSTKRMQDRVLEKHEGISDAEMAVLMAQVSFQRQEDEWKNVLLRGHEEDKLQEHWAEFEKKEGEVRETMEGFRGMLSDESVAKGLAGTFVREHEALGGLYREGLVVFQVGGEGAQMRGDGLVQGRAKNVAAILRDIVGILEADRDLMEKSVNEITVRRSMATIVAILITALFAFVVLALALNHWMNLSILTAGRKKTQGGAVGSSSLAPVGGKRVLVIEREAARLERLVEQVGSWGCEVLRAGSASEAARILELNDQASGGGDADLVVTGGDMVGVCGFALARWLRAEASTCGIPLVLFDSGELARSGESGEVFDAVVDSSMSGEKLKKRFMKLMKKVGGEEREIVPLDYAVEYPRARGVRVLVAEDDPMNRKYLGLMLEKVGMDFELVENGQEAVDAMEREQFAVVLMDCSMPVMDGYEATRKIREMQGDGDQALVVGVTAHTDAEAHGKCRESGMDTSVCKPLKLEYLCIVIEEELAKRGVEA